VRVRKRLEWSPRAGRDLAAIEAFYAEYSQVTADRVIVEIRRRALQLETYP
jgi:plasmid stabilization system protein ParE